MSRVKSRSMVFDHSTSAQGETSRLGDKGGGWKVYEGSVGYNESMDVREKLLEMEKSGKYMFHGSPDEIKILEPRQPYSFDKKLEKMVEDGGPAVAGTPYADVAIFRAIVNRKNVPEHYWSGFGYDPDNKMLHFEVSRDTYKQIGDKFGYVHVLNKKDFRPKDPQNLEGMDWRSEKVLQPMQVIKVSSEDLPKNIQIK